MSFSKVCFNLLVVRKKNVGGERRKNVSDAKEKRLSEGDKRKRPNVLQLHKLQLRPHLPNQLQGLAVPSLELPCPHPREL